jgi:hypothetical protein
MSANIIKLFLVLLWVTLSVCQAAYAQSVTPEVRQLLQQADKNGRWWSITADDPLLDRLRAHGIRTATNLKPYLQSAEVPKAIVLQVMEILGQWDDETLEAVEELAFESKETAPRSLAFRIVLNNKPRDQAVHFGLSTVGEVDGEQLGQLMAWTARQDPLWHRDSPEAQQLVRLTIQRMKALVAQPHSRELVASLAIRSEQFPFDDPQFLKETTDVFLTALANPGKMSDIAIGAAFRVVKKNSSVAAETVQKGLLAIVQQSTMEVTKILLWQIFQQQFNKPDFGAQLVQESLKKWPQLADYTKRLEQTTFSVHWGDDPIVSRDVQQTLYKLWGWERK